MYSIAEQAREREVNLRRRKTAWIRRSVRLGAAGLALALVIAGAVIAWRAPSLRAATADLEAAAMRLSARVGLTINRIDVTGRARTTADDLRAALGAVPGAPILAFDVRDARERLEQLNWIKTAEVERRLPDRLRIVITERQPVALWQRDDGRHVLIDGDGVPLQDRELREFVDLPVVVGADAPQTTAELLAMLDTIPALRAQVEGAQRIGGRRWNVKLRSGIYIRLPADDPASAWQRLADLQARTGVLERDVLMIDLRLPDRTYVRLPPDAAERLRNPDIEQSPA